MYYINVYSYDFDSVYLYVYDNCKDAHAETDNDITREFCGYDYSYSLEEEFMLSTFDKMVIACSMIIDALDKMHKTPKSVEFTKVRFVEAGVDQDVQPINQMKELLNFMWGHTSPSLIKKKLNKEEQEI